MVGLIALISPCAFCWWIFIGNELVFQARLPIYPGAQEIANAEGYYGANTDTKTLYFWTQNSSDNVRSYYETFTLPFLKMDYPFTFVKSEHSQTIFNPSGKLIPSMTDEFTGEAINLSEQRACDYHLDYQCIEVDLIDFGQSESVVLRPPDGPMRMIVTPVAPAPELQGGTLIIYTYYVAGF